MDLGATPAQAFCKVMVPYLAPAIISGALMSFTLSLDELIVTYFTASAGTRDAAARDLRPRQERARPDAQRDLDGVHPVDGGARRRDRAARSRSVEPRSRATDAMSQLWVAGICDAPLHSQEDADRRAKRSPVASVERRPVTRRRRPRSRRRSRGRRQAPAEVDRSSTSSPGPSTSRRRSSTASPRRPASRSTTRPTPRTRRCSRSSLAGGTKYDLIQPSEYTIEALVKREAARADRLVEGPEHQEHRARVSRTCRTIPSRSTRVPWMVGTVGIVVNTEKVKEPVKGYKDVFQDKYKGRIVVLDDTREIVTWALATHGRCRPTT